MLDKNGFTFKKTILAVGRSDLRKGIDGLAAMVKLKYGLYIRLADGCFQWPRTAQEARSITTEEFKRLMDGFSIDSSARPKRIPPVNASKTKRK